MKNKSFSKFHPICLSVMMFYSVCASAVKPVLPVGFIESSLQGWIINITGYGSKEFCHLKPIREELSKNAFKLVQDNQNNQVGSGIKELASGISSIVATSFEGLQVKDIEALKGKIEREINSTKGQIKSFEEGDEGFPNAGQTQVLSNVRLVLVSALLNIQSSAASAIQGRRDYNKAHGIQID